MTLYDSSLLIDYLAGDDPAVTYVTDHADERAVTVPLVLFEVYQGEVYKTGTADFTSVDAALDWVTVREGGGTLARTAAELQARLHERGASLAARDAFVAGAAAHLDERLAVSDADFDSEALRSAVDVDVVAR